ncbi:MAG TPA: hypothetical protein PKI60_01425 [Oscillospiraceae bacterium]|nr:hypothetical protein [Oscillospiraceae bacterium]
MKKQIVRKVLLILSGAVFVMILSLFIIPPKKFNHNFNQLTNMTVNIQISHEDYVKFDIPEKDYKMLYTNINKLNITRFFRYPDHSSSYQRDPYADFCFDFNGEKEYVSFGYDDKCVFFPSDSAFCGDEAYMYGYDKKISPQLKEYIDNILST